jgi:isopentenyl diphosphate isomerase/L-lactate dehydrogenase-like FMN-dependent dehydrogenase
MTIPSLNRRQALAAYASLAASPLLRAQQQQLIGEPPGRIPSPSELVNAFEFELMAQRRLDDVTYAEIAGSDRVPIDRITFNPRMMVNTTELDLTTPLFGDNLFAPVLIGPIADLKRFHPKGELEMARGASAAKTAMVVADHSSVPIDQIIEQAKMPLWCQIYPGPDASAARNRAVQAVKVGCKGVILTAGIPYLPAGATGATSLLDWKALDQIRQSITVPVVLKGIMTPEEARTAVSHGFQGIVVSNYGGRSIPATASSILALPAIADAVGDKAAILVDGGFRRGSDVLKALALGAQGVLLGRPAVWSLAAYGADGVQNMLQLIQNELARDMMMCGLVNLKSIMRAAVTIHTR